MGEIRRDDGDPFEDLNYDPVEVDYEEYDDYEFPDRRNNLPVERIYRWAFGILLIFIAILIFRSAFLYFNKNTTQNDDASYRSGTTVAREIPESNQNAVPETEVQTAQVEAVEDTTEELLVPEPIVQSTIETGYEVECNDVFGDANEVLLNNVYRGSLASAYSSEKDWYRFNISENGISSIKFSTVMQEKNASFWDISLRSAESPDKRIWREYVYGHDTDFESVLFALSPGTYFFVVESSNEWTEDQYAFEITFEAKNDWEIEDNDSFLNANDISLNTEYHGVLQERYSTEEDWYRFTLPQSGVVTVVWHSEMQEVNHSYWDIRLHPSDNPDENIFRDYIYGYTTDYTSILLPISAGTYYFEVEASNEWSADPYTFEIHYETPENWEVESNNGFLEANEISFNTEYHGVVKNSYSTETDWYSFYLDSPATITVQINTPILDDRAYYWDYSLRSGDDPDRKMIRDSIRGTEGNGSFSTELEAGTYYFVVTSSNEWSPEPYSFVIMR